jgi:predicted DsbA family dithiol-disulfide isomerase
MAQRFGAQIEWMPFDLHPEYPPEGVPRGPRSEQMAATFEANGLVYNPPPIRPNSMKALRLAEHARARERFEPMHRRLMDAYWAEAQDIGSDEVLAALAADAGVEGADELLAGDEYRDRVRRSTAAAHELGISGIPGFLLNKRLLVLGAHPAETFENAFAHLT